MTSTNQRLRSTGFAIRTVTYLVFSSMIFCSAMFCSSVSVFAEDLAGKKSKADVESTERVLRSIEFLASDELKGRGIGTAGIDKAAEFVKAEFARVGLKTDAVKGDAWQKFDVPWKTELGPKKNNRLVLVPDVKDGQSSKQTELVLGRDFTPMGDSGSAKVSGPVIFAGYGISAKDEKYDDYADIDVKGKIVLILRREPQQNDPHSIFEGTENSNHAFFRTKVSNAFSNGAAALIIVNDAFGLKQETKTLRNKMADTIEEIEKAKADFIAAKKLDIEQIQQYAKKIEELAGKLETAAKALSQPVDKLVPFRDAGGFSRRKMPVVFAKRSSVADLIAKNFDGKTLSDLEREIDQTLKPVTKELSGFKLEIETNINRQKANVKNVIAVLPGKGELAKEHVVIGAHYDHVGMGGTGSGSLTPWTSEIHNGADDNASGTAGLIEIARRMAKLESDNHRTLVFIAFTGEERGLLGSAYYVKHPVFALEQTAAMVNLDMIGRLKENKLIVYGTGTADGFDKLVDDANEESGFKIVKKPTGYGPSDHESFYTRKIPVFHVFTGLHQDYHRPSDDVDKVNIDGTARIAAFTSRIVRELAITPDRPKYIAIERERDKMADRSGERAYFGSQPDFGSEVEEGYAISGATAGSPAQKAGLKGGDVIIKVGDSRIGGLEDFDSALRKYKTGQTVKVVVIRDGKEKAFDVVLESR